MDARLTAAPPADVTGPLVSEDLRRQAEHWLAAARTFLDAEEFAPAAAWAGLEQQTGMPLRRRLGVAVDELIALGVRTRELAMTARTPEGRRDAGRAVQLLRRRYTQVETTLDFFGDAVSSRTSPRLRATLGLLDTLATDSMRIPLQAAGQAVPAALIYVKPGLGASILRAGTRLWSPGTINPVAAIKLVRHNLYRPTSLFHETGHQVAHLTRWVPSVRGRIEQVFADDEALRRLWSPWASEIAADVFAFLWTGFASVTALYDVVGDARTILRWPLGDPHPVGWLRTRLGCALCRTAYGTGPWDRLERAMMAEHRLERADATLRPLLERSGARLADLSAALLGAPVPALGARPMTAVIDPARVSPTALADFERTAGGAAWASPQLRMSDGIRLIALAGLREAETPDDAQHWIDRAHNWMSLAA